MRLKVDRITLAAPIPGAIGVFTTVNLARTYTNPVVFVLPTDQNPDPSTVRIRNVTSTSFEMAVIEAPQNFGGSLGLSAMDISYLVLEAGSYSLGGITMEVGVGGATPTNAALNTLVQQGRNAGGTINWVNLNFSGTYTTEPAVLLQVQSDNNETLDPLQTSTPYLEMTARNITTTGMQFALERAETSGAVSNNESVGYLAIASNSSGSFAAASTINFQTFRTSDTITGNCTNFTYNSASLGAAPIVLASQNTRDGGDGGWIRRCNLASTTQIGLEVDEDLAADTDRAHTDERAGMLLFSSAFDTTVGGLAIEAGSVTTPAQVAVPATLNFTIVNFPNAFASDNVLIFPMPSSEGVRPASLRVRNIDRNGFQIAQVEPTGELGAHESMTIDYIAVEAGTHTLANGVLLEAGTINTAQTIAGTGPAGGFTTLNLVNTFTAPPVLLTQVQSINSEAGMDPSNVSVPWLTVAVATGSVTNNSAQIALERAEAIAGTVVSESIGYLAITPSIQESLLDDNGNSINYQTLVTADNILGPDDGDGCFENNFAASFTTGTVRAVAGPRRRDGVNGYWLRRCLLSNTQIGLFADEDRANDTERNHTTEIASVLAFDNSFESCLEAGLQVEKLVSVIQDPVNIAANPKAINGAELTYQVRITNPRAGSTVNDTLVIEDDLPVGVNLFIGDGVTSPFTIVNNTDSGAGNTLVFTAFGGFASTTDSYQFSSNDGVDFNYTPVDPDGDQYDPAITHFRIVPTGNMTAADASYTAEVQISYQVRIN